ncbi:glycosyltransferase family 2 protein, partial [bacterium]|nr:glycosyltransferase family 2 protein [bacterium]
MNKCDIVIPVWNELVMTKECLESIYKNTRTDYRLIIIDNGSDEETKEYFRAISHKSKFKVTLIRNKKNIGALKALNQGMNLSDAEFVCLLNNDTQVTDGWLTEMIKVAESSEDIGIVNANSNTFGCRPKRRQPLEILARELKSYSGEYSELAWASGFCMLIKRKLIQEVGLFDEIYGMGTFEDADFCKRAQDLGYLSVCAKAAYVYHH